MFHAEAPSSAGYDVVLGGALVLRMPRDFDVSRVAALVKAGIKMLCAFSQLGSLL